mmetsp:Transcript_4533/g.5951  ORF Transcript_4533/g.5951 Transcript_4533/m.5951 type:complete len:130 (+) Transcript_4533:97-486(+)
MSGSEASDASVSTKTSESESNSDLSDSENDFEKQEIDKSGEVQEEVRLKDITQIEEISSLMDIFRARLQMRFPAQKFEDLMPPPPNQDVKLPPSSAYQSILEQRRIFRTIKTPGQLFQISTDSVKEIRG